MTIVIDEPELHIHESILEDYGKFWKESDAIVSLYILPIVLALLLTIKTQTIYGLNHIIIKVGIFNG